MENQGCNCELPGGIQEPQEPLELQQDLVDAPRRRNEQRRRLRTRQSSASFEATRCLQLLQPVPSCSSRKSEDSAVMLRIYDVMGAEVVSGLNCLCRVIDTGAFHAGVEVHGLEWSFGFSEDGSGVFSCTPGECGGHAYREAVSMGETSLGEEDVMILLSTLAQDWQGSDYDILRRNCCHFSDALCRQLQVGHIPGWVTNLAGAGAKVEAGLRNAVSHVHAAAVIAAAKAMEIEEELNIKQTVSEGAHHLLERSFELDQRYAISESASELATNAGRAAADAVEQVNDATSTVVNKVTEAALQRSASLAYDVAAQVTPPILGYMCLGARKQDRQRRIRS